MKIIEDYVYHFTKDNKPVYELAENEKIIFKTFDCFTNQITSNEDLIDSIDYDKVNPATGPVYIKGAKAGDVIKVNIEKIEVADKGVALTIPGVGPLDDIVETRTKVLEIKNGKVEFNDINFDINPMIGVIGVAPKNGKISCGLSGDHGGNMDNKKIVEGTSVYFPVNVDGALLQMGDLHAVMGDGEICGTGLEIPGEVTISVEVIKNANLNRPLLEDDNNYYTIASAKTYEEAVELASKDMQELISKSYSWDITDTFIYMSLQSDVEICQGARPSDWDIIVRVKVPKLKDKKLI